MSNITKNNTKTNNNICQAIKKDNKQCKYKVKFGCFCGIHAKKPQEKDQEKDKEAQETQETPIKDQQITQEKDQEKDQEDQEDQEIYKYSVVFNFIDGSKYTLKGTIADYSIEIDNAKREEFNEFLRKERKETENNTYEYYIEGKEKKIYYTRLSIDKNPQINLFVIPTTLSKFKEGIFTIKETAREYDTIKYNAWYISKISKCFVWCRRNTDKMTKKYKIYTKDNTQYFRPTYNFTGSYVYNIYADELLEVNID